MATSSGRDTAPRQYNSPARQRQAEQTRARILAAAREAFRSRGYAATTVEAIASAARVSAKTVEAAFGSKRAILAALVDPLATAGPPQRLVNQIRETADPRQRLRLVAELTRHVYEAAQPEFELMRGAAYVAPEIAAAAGQVEARRRDNQTRLVGWLSERQLLRSDLDPDEAADIVWSLTSYDLFRALVTERAWPADRYQAWLGDALARYLLRP